jgi:aspartyl-tRNA(Asn)/glutamyl-tRNA(Gln) amidotransferase subunit B
LVGAVRAAIAANPKAVADFHAGKESAIKFLVGQVMRETRGRANAGVVSGLLEKELNV